ncbi:MAG: hypothetical protein JJ895_05045 [Balneolaceae bacterium]|nr:hypothetical protein [Balneolaceae bacterium]
MNTPDLDSSLSLFFSKTRLPKYSIQVPQINFDKELSGYKASDLDALEKSSLKKFAHTLKIVNDYNLEMSGIINAIYLETLSNPFKLDSKIVNDPHGIASNIQLAEHQDILSKIKNLHNVLVCRVNAFDSMKGELKFCTNYNTRIPDCQKKNSYEAIKYFCLKRDEHVIKATEKSYHVLFFRQKISDIETLSIGSVRKDALPDCISVATDFYERKENRVKKFTAEEISKVMRIAKAYIQDNSLSSLNSKIEDILRNCEGCPGSRNTKRKWIEYYGKKANLLEDAAN